MALAIVVAALGGLIIGSFLNVVIVRLPKRESVASGRSQCPSCGATIKAYDNVPLLSWLVLRGRCRSCGAAISARYPLVEALTAVLYAVTVAVHYDDTAELVLGLALVTFLIPIAAIDLELRRLPNPIVLTAFVAGVVLLVPALLLAGRTELLVSAAVGAAASFAFYLLLALVGRGGMGMGDVKLAGVLGLYLGALGWAPLAVGLAAAFATGAIAGVVTLIARRSLADRSLPFGPWMFAGAWIGIFGGDAIAAGYLRLVGLG